MEFHYITLRVPEGRIAEFDQHLAVSFPAFNAPDGMILIIAASPEQPGIYHLTSVLANREQVFLDARAAGGGSLLLHPLIDQFGAEIVNRNRATVVALATPRWNYPSS